MFVVSYSISTSNHNFVPVKTNNTKVVSYSISTSNHNSKLLRISLALVVSYSISTSNHNCIRPPPYPTQLCLILFLHQTTTKDTTEFSNLRCVLFYFYIKPQLSILRDYIVSGCVLFYFYIKPQLNLEIEKLASRCVLFYFYIKPQP